MRIIVWTRRLLNVPLQIRLRRLAQEKREYEARIHHTQVMRRLAA